MPYRIPDDWDGEDWACIKLYWPNSPGWMGILRGVVSSFRRGRLWDESTGSVRDTQQIGWDIFLKSFPFVPCCDDSGGNLHEPDDSDNGSFAYFGLESECEVDVSVIDIKIENGELWMKKLPCCTWFLVGKCCAGVGSDVYEETDPPIETFSACGRAYAVVDFLRAVGATTWDQRDNLPWHYCKNIKSEHSLSGGCSHFVAAVKIAIEMTALGYSFDGTLNDESTWRSILCRLEAVYEAIGDPLTDDEWDAIKSAVDGVFGIDIPSRSFWGYVINGIGRGDMSEVAQLGAQRTGFDCTCPNLDETEPTENGWYLGSPAADLVIESTTSSGWTPTCRSHTPEHDVYGVVFEVIHPVTGPADLKKMSRSTACSGETGTSLWGDTSGNSTSHPRVGTAVDTVMDELFGEGNYALSSGGVSWSSNPASPTYAGGTTLVEAWELGVNLVDEATIRNVRFIHNSNSPSHSS